MRDCNSQIPPTDIEAEQRLLGAILHGAPIPAGLRGEHFADPIHTTIFAAIDVAAWDGGLPFPAGTVDAFNRTGALHEVGGTPYLKQLMAMGACDAATAADAIRDTWARRQLVDLAETIATEAFAGRLNSEEIGALAHGRLNALAAAPPDDERLHDSLNLLGLDIACATAPDGPRSAAPSDIIGRMVQWIHTHAPEALASAADGAP